VIKASRQFAPLFPGMTVGVMGSAGGKLTNEIRKLVYQLGSCIARHGYVLITGACPGIPHDAASGAHSEGGIVIGISPGLNLEEHVKKYHCPTRYYNAIIYTGSGLMGREIENIRTCDVIIFAGGRSGTLGEFAIAYDEGKAIGVLEGTGGIAENIKKIVGMIDKQTNATMCYDKDPQRLLAKLEEIYKKFILPTNTKIVKGHNPDGVLDL
jgi:uncharacterized protein (TIGR00725 family)